MFEDAHIYKIEKRKKKRKNCSQAVVVGWWPLQDYLESMKV
jgi:hypothetical protein